MPHGLASLRTLLASEYHSIHAYAAYDAHLAKVERWLTPQLYPVLGCNASTVRQRLVQRLTELTLGPFVTELARHVRRSQPFLHPEGALLELDGILVYSRSGRVGLTLPFLARACLDFGAHWLHTLYSILRIGAGVPRGKATLVFGVGVESLFQDGDDRRFCEYCRRSLIAPLTSASRLLVQHVAYTGTCTDERVTYARHPFGQLASEISLSWRERATLLIRHLLMPARYVWAMLRCPPLALLSRDFALGPFLAMLDRAGAIEAVVFTNSNYTIQPLWARAPRTYETHMVWYSQNAIPFVMKADNITADLPNYHHMQIDVHWVWTPGFRSYLMERAGRMQRVELVGPVTWYLPESAAGKNGSIRIAVFDVTPISDAYAESIGLLANYYNPATAMGFLDGILAATAALRETQDVDCTIQLKHKRQYSPTHDPGYIARVAGLLDREEIELAPFDINIYRFIKESDVIIVIPNSSPAYIASRLNVPAIYFDPSAKMRPTFEKADGIFFASGERALAELLISLLEQHGTEPKHT
jgi:hypothetical protein